MAESAMSFDRRVSDELLAALGPDGWLRPLVVRAGSARQLLDLQFRRSGPASRLSLYAGLTVVLDVFEREGSFRLAAHPTHRDRGGFDVAWLEWQPAGELAACWAAVEAYLDRLLDGHIDARWLSAEGRLQSAMSWSPSDYRMAQREAVIAFPSTLARSAAMASAAAPIQGAVSGTGRDEPWWPGVAGAMPSLGNELDLLGVDDEGRILVVEAKPAEALAGIVWGPAQVAVYAELFACLYEQPGQRKALEGMLGQRRRIGLLDDGPPPARPVQVVPVLAIGAGALSPVAPERLAAIAEVVASVPAHPSVQPLEVWLVAEDGVVVDMWGAAGAPPAAMLDPSGGWLGTGGTGFQADARAAAARWKEQTRTLPAEAKEPAPYGTNGPLYAFCLPPEFADRNLLPEAREIGLTRFEAAGIHWHRGIDGGPTNHLLSSQVQCVNALAPFVDDPDGLRQLFGDVLDVAEVLPFGADTDSPHDKSDHVVFEWPGLVDHLGEWGPGGGGRGAHNTSADAAFRYRTSDGTTELALVEWKYTERYTGEPLKGGPEKMAIRHERYRPFWEDAACPVRNDLIPYEDLFVEPFYQLFRTQLLAWRMELTGERGASRVRFVYAAPSANAELWSSLSRPSHHAAAEVPSEPHSVLTAWRRMVHEPDRFLFLDVAGFVATDAPTSAEFRHRYSHLRLTRSAT